MSLNRSSLPNWPWSSPASPTDSPPAEACKPWVSRLPAGLRREFHLQALAASHDLDFVFLIGLHLAERVGVIVYVFDLAPGQLDYLVSGFQPGFCGGRIVAYGVEQHPVIRLGVVRHSAEIDAEAGRAAARLATGNGIGRTRGAAINRARAPGAQSH